MRVLVCGGRDYRDKTRLSRVLDFVHKERGIGVLIHGAARGADTLAAEWARVAGVQTEAFPADWATHGKKAGPIRNQQMLDEARPDAVVAFPGGSGTADMIARSKAAGLPVWELV